MGAQIREYRQRIRSVSATKKITRAMELMAASRVVKAQQAVRESTPYARALTRAVSAVATFSNEDHPLTSEKEDVKQAAVLIIAADRGLAGGYNSNGPQGERAPRRPSSSGEGKEVSPLPGRAKAR
jgi:F-type H+-transporting ATPase subunit gamma